MGNDCRAGYEQPHQKTSTAILASGRFIALKAFAIFPPRLLLPRFPRPDYDPPKSQEHGGSEMIRHNTSEPEISFFNLGHAKWVVGVLSMLVAVVGRESLLGLILRQTRSEIKSLIADEEPSPAAIPFENN
jgi:hypothetical protein